MIPFINVIFLLMVFFLLAITWQKAEGVLENRIPQIKTRSDSESSRAWETVSLKMKVNKITLFTQLLAIQLTNI